MLWYLTSIASVSKAWLDSLPPDLQEAVKQTGVHLEDEMFQWQLEQDEANRATWDEQGGTITPLSDEDREEAEAAVAQVTEAFLDGTPSCARPTTCWPTPVRTDDRREQPGASARHPERAGQVHLDERARPAPGPRGVA